MPWFEGLIGLVLLCFAVYALVDGASTVITLCYALGATLALAAFKPSLPMSVLRFLASLSAVLFLSCFGLAFMATSFVDDVVSGHYGTLQLLIAGFITIPLLSHFSCRMKAGCSAYFACRSSSAAAPKSA